VLVLELDDQVAVGELGELTALVDHQHLVESRPLRETTLVRLTQGRLVEEEYVVAANRLGRDACEERLWLWSEGRALHRQ